MFARRTDSGAWLPASISARAPSAPSWSHHSRAIQAGWLCLSAASSAVRSGSAAISCRASRVPRRSTALTRPAPRGARSLASSTDSVDRGVVRHALEEGELVEPEPQRVAQRRVELPGGPPGERPDQVVERRHPLHGPVGELRRQAAVAPVQAGPAGLRHERPVRPGAVVEDALEHAKGDHASGSDGQRGHHSEGRSQTPWAGARWVGVHPVALLAAASLIGTLGSDLLIVKGTAGREVHGGGGGDQILGGPGPDRLSGEYGRDRIWGDAGDDAIDGGNGGDALTGDAGDDVIVGGFGHDTVAGGTGNDIIDTGPAPDIVAGNAGDDVIHLGPGGDVADAGAGNDTVYVDSGPDVIAAGEGDDTVFANTGNPVRRVDCGPGDDILFVNPPFNPHHVSARYVGCETIMAAEPPVDPDRGIWADVETDAGGQITGTPKSDRLFGRAGADTLIGLAGNDELWGNHLPTGTDVGTDVLDGGEGDDIVFGGRDRNLILGGPGNDQLENGIRTNAIYGGPGDDTVILRGDGRGPNLVDAGDGDDSIRASSRGAATIDCGPGRDTLEVGSNRRVRWRHCERVSTHYSG